MKRRRHRFKLIALFLFAAFLGLGIWSGWSVWNYGSRWFSHTSNPRLNARRQAVIEGSVTDRNGVTLAATEDGQRVFHTDAATRSALVHLLGDRHGQIANSVESFHAGYLYGYQSSLLDAVYHLVRKTPRQGNSLTLTVNAELSAAIPGFFEKYPLSAGHSGAAVVMNYRTGEVLAMISLPSYDPDHVTQELVDALDHPYWNRADQALYPPGSTFKIVTAAAMLATLPDAAQKSYTCTGTLKLSDTFSVRDFGNAAHGSVTLREAFLRSCNIVFANGALSIGRSVLLRTAEQFGFNENFLFRDLIVSNSAFPRNNISPESLAASGYGQSSVVATPLHMCLISAAVANDGIMMEPRILKTVRSFSGAVVLPWSSSSERTVCSPDIARTLQNWMKDVVQGGGSGSKASVPTLDIRGKTGTAESTSGGRKINYGWFTGFCAQRDLPFALCVLVEDIPDGETGGTAAAPIVSDIFSWLRLHPDSVL